MQRTFRAFLCAVACLVLASGCKVTEGDIDVWMGTIKGPGKIVAVLLDGELVVDTRESE